MVVLVAGVVIVAEVITNSTHTTSSTTSTFLIHQLAIASYPDAPQTAIARKINFYLVFYSVLNINYYKHSANVTIFRIKL